MTALTSVTIVVACTTYNYAVSNCIPPEWIPMIVKPISLILIGV
jgi:hypothetical protein